MRCENDIHRKEKAVADSSTLQVYENTGSSFPLAHGRIWTGGSAIQGAIPSFPSRDRVFSFMKHTPPAGN